MYANREGRFRGRVFDKGVNETGPNKLCTLVLRFLLSEEYLNGEWRDISAEGLEVVAYCYIEKRDGTLNDFQINLLKEAFGWPGLDPFWFDNQSTLPEAQVTLELDEYKGKQRIAVRFINRYDAKPSAGVTHADANQRRAMTARLGHKLRAYSGGKPAPAAKPTGAPKAPPKQTSPQAEGKSAATMDETWKLFAQWAETDKVNEAELHEAWFKAIQKVCTHEDAERVTPEQWAEIRTSVSDCPF